MRRAADIAYLITFTFGAWLLGLAFTTRDKDGLVYFMFGKAIVFVMLVFTLVRVVSDRIQGKVPSAISMGALIGSAIGAIVGSLAILNAIAPFARAFAYPLVDMAGVYVGIASFGTIGMLIGAVKKGLSPA